MLVICEAKELCGNKEKCVHAEPHEYGEAVIDIGIMPYNSPCKEAFCAHIFGLENRQCKCIPTGDEEEIE